MKFENKVPSHPLPILTIHIKLFTSRPFRKFYYKFEMAEANWLE